MDTTQRADRGAKAEEIGGYTEGDFMDTSSVQVIFSTHRILNSVIEWGSG